jgi:hypothetical protein
MPGRIASNKSRKNNPVVIEGSLNERMGRTPAFPFCAVAFAHLSISWSVGGRPDFEREEEFS